MYLLCSKVLGTVLGESLMHAHGLYLEIHTILKIYLRGFVPKLTMMYV